MNLFLEADAKLKQVNPSDTVWDKEDIELTLFHKCNLSCSFCKLPQGDSTGLSEIEIENKFKILRQYLDRCTKDILDVEILGGEIFNDLTPDSVLKKIETEVIKTNNYNHKKLNFTFTTNLIFKKSTRVKRIIEDLKKKNIELSLMVSYDPLGRYPGSLALDLFKANEKILSEHITNVGFIVLKGLSQWLDGDTEYLDYLYSRHPLYMSLYHSNDFLYGKPEQDILARPLADEVVECIKKISIKYPKTYPLDEIQLRANKELSSNEKADSCTTRLMIQPDDKIFFCGTTGFGKKQEDVLQVMKKNDCFMCEYYPHCFVYCYDELEIINEDGRCFYKEMYESLKD